MRPVRVDVTGTTDKAGNASIPIRLPVAGEWHDLKVAASTTGPAEWALIISGSAVTYGRGRRVTLGPELLQDGEQLMLNVTGGPPLAAISGTVTGRGGSPDEILAGWGPQPNTIALDATTPRKKLFPDGVTPPAGGLGPSYTTAGGLSTPQTFTIPTGTTDLRIMVTAGGLLFFYNLLVVGVQSGVQYFGAPLAPGSVAPVPTPTLPFTIPVEYDADTQVQVIVNSSIQVSVFVHALFAPEAPGQAGTAQSVITPVPAPWQAPSFTTGGTFVVAAGVDHTLISGVANARIYWFDLLLNHNGNTTYIASLWDGPSANNVQLAELRMPLADTAAVHAVGGGSSLNTGDDLVIRVDNEAVGTTTYFTIGWSRA